MNILVCINQVPDTTSKIRFTDDNKKFYSIGVQYIINPYDELALSRAVDIEGADITVLHVGTVDSEASIRKALAIGATKAVRVDAEARDAWFVAHQIAEYAKDKSFDLILFGKESIDFNGSQVPAMVAELLDWPSVSICRKLELEGDRAIVDKEIAGGKETLSIELPLIIGATEGIAEVKIPNMRGIMSARSKPLEVIPAIEVEELSYITEYEKPEERGAVTLVDANNINELIDLLHNKSKVI